MGEEIFMNPTIETFNLHIEKSSKDVFLACVKDENGNVLATNVFQYRIDPFILSRLEESVGRNIPENATSIKNFGRELFNKIFSGEILGFYKSFLKQRKPIRIRLFFKKEEPELLRIPWEFMYDGENYLSAYPETVLSRLLEAVPSPGRERIQGKIKILAVVSGPLDLKDHERLQIGKEQEIILQAVDRAVSQIES